MKDEEHFDAITRRIGAGFVLTPRETQRLLSELVEHQTLILELREEGCPWREVNGGHVCVYCDGPQVKTEPGAEPEYRHGGLLMAEDQRQEGAEEAGGVSGLHPVCRASASALTLGP